MDRTEHLEIAARQHGVVARRQLLEVGWTYGQVDWLVRSGQWTRVTPAVLRRSGSPSTDRQAAVEAVLDAGVGSRISHLSAAHLWGRSGCPLRPFTVVRASGSRRQSELSTVHKVSSLPDRWVTTLDGVPIARPELVAMHLFDVCSEHRAAQLVDRLWSDRLLSGRSINALLGDLGAQGRNGVAGLRRYFELRGIDYTPPASGLEGRAAELMDEVGIHLDRQVDTGDGERWIGRVDFRHPTLPFVLEIQSEKYHAALCDRESDAERIAALEAAGFVVVEVTDAMVWSRPSDFVAAVRSGVRLARGW